MSTVPFGAPTAVPAGKDIKKTIRDAYETRKKTKQTLEQLKTAEEDLIGKVDIWTSDVASRGVDLNTATTAYETAKKDSEAHQKKIEAVEYLEGLVERRIKQLKNTNATEVADVIREQITILQKAKTTDEKDVLAADEAIKELWEEVKELTPAKTVAKRKEDEEK